MTVRYTNPDPSCHSHPDGTVTMHWYDFTTGRTEPAVELVLDPWAALDLLRSLGSAVTYALRDALDDALAGPCAHCHQHRLVDVPARSGPGTEHVHCPECHPRVERAALRARYAASVPALIFTGEALL